VNKKSISNQDTQIFKAELEKFRAHQNRILQANHKQKALLNELTRSYDALLQDKRVRSEQSKYEAFNRQRAAVLARYRKVYQAFNDLVTGLMRAQGFYSEMKDTVESLSKNVETFVSNRRNEGGQLLSSIENSKNSSSNSGLVDWERGGLNQLMERMTMDSNPTPPMKSPPPTATRPGYSQAGSNPAIPPYTPGLATSQSYTPGLPTSGMTSPPVQREYTYNPQHMGPVSPPPNTATFYQQGAGGHFFPPPLTGGMPPRTATFGGPQQRFSSYGQQPQSAGLPSQGQSGQMPPGWQPPPPPPGPPPSQQDMNFGLPADGQARYPSGPGGYAANQPRQSQAGRGNDPWGSLNNWG